jgi:hypothetical protein
MKEISKSNRDEITYLSDLIESHADIKTISKKLPIQKSPVTTVATEHKDEASPKNVLSFIELIENRFIESTGLHKVDLSQYPLMEDKKLQVITDKGKSDEHGEVFTPLWLVDDMLDRWDNKSWKDQSATTEDLCAGYGQFTIRMLRKKYSLIGEKFKIKTFLTETHLFVELQPNSCFHLLYTFSTGIRLLIGDALKKKELPDDAEKGIWVWSASDAKWSDHTKKVKELFNKHNKKGSSVKNNAFNFEEEFKNMSKG